MKRMLIILACASPALLAGCTGQQSAKSFGGTATLDLPVCRKLVNVTWKEDDIWYLTRQMLATDSVESYNLSESSSFGLLQGTVILKERRDNTCS